MFPNGVCEVCGAEGFNDRHRIDGNGGYTKGNVKVLCRVHHVEAHEQEKRAKIAELRDLISEEHEKPVEAAVVPLTYRDDYGRVISERQWRILEKRKSDAIAGGYEIDEYSQ